MTKGVLAGGVLLAIDTTLLPGTVALSKEGQVVSEREVEKGVQFSGAFLPALSSIVEEVGIALDEITGIVVSRGPGSFTGIRVGISFACGAARALGVPLFPLSTLDAMAHGAPEGYSTIFPALDARKGEVYTALYRRRGASVIREGDYISIKPENLIYKIVSNDSYVCGPGYIRYRDKFKEGGLGPFPEEKDSIECVNARSLLIYFLSSRDREGKEPDEVHPLYVRPSEAELKRKRR